MLEEIIVFGFIVSARTCVFDSSTKYTQAQYRLIEGKSSYFTHIIFNESL